MLGQASRNASSLDQAFMGHNQEQICFSFASPTNCDPGPFFKFSEAPPQAWCLQPNSVWHGLAQCKPVWTATDIQQQVNINGPRNQLHQCHSSYQEATLIVLAPKNGDGGAEWCWCHVFHTPCFGAATAKLEPFFFASSGSGLLASGHEECRNTPDCRLRKPNCLQPGPGGSCCEKHRLVA